MIPIKFNDIRRAIELIFEKYRKNKYYTLFMNDYNTSVTSTIDEIGGGKSNITSDKVANAAIKVVDQKSEAIEFVRIVEQAVEQLPNIEKRLVRSRYMNRDHNYISDYTVYEVKLCISAPYYNKLRKRAFINLYTMLSNLI